MRGRKKKQEGIRKNSLLTKFETLKNSNYIPASIRTQYLPNISHSQYQSFRSSQFLIKFQFIFNLKSINYNNVEYTGSVFAERDE
jgi:hypothetical protein